MKIVDRLFKKKTKTVMDHLSLQDLDVTEAINPVSDRYLTWPGKEDGKPKPDIIWYGKENIKD